MTNVDEALLNPIRPIEEKHEVEMLDGNVAEGQDRINENNDKDTVKTHLRRMQSGQWRSCRC